MAARKAEPVKSAATWLVGVMWGLAIGGAVAALLLRHQNSQVQLAGLDSGPERLAAVLLGLFLLPAAGPVYTTMGAAVAWSRPRHPIGWLCLGGGLVLVGGDVCSQLAVGALEVTPRALPGRFIAAWLAGFIPGTLLWPVAVLVLLLFPDGRLPAPAWRRVTWLVAGGAILAGLAAVLRPTLAVGYFTTLANPTGLDGIGYGVLLLAGAANVMALLALLAALAAVRYRWQRAAGHSRQQLKWLLFAGAVILVCLAGWALTTFITGRSYPAVLAGALSLGSVTIGLPLALGIALLRRPLVEIDVIINRTMVYSTLLGFLAALYYGCVLLLQRLFGYLLGRESDLAVVISTLVVAALFAPLRRRIQAVVDRRFYPHKYDAAQAVAAFSARLQQEVNLDRITEDLLTVVDQTVEPSHVSLWLRRLK